MKKIIFLFSIIISASAVAQQADPALTALLDEKDPAALEQKLTALGSGSEKDLDLLSSYYVNKRDWQKMDSVKNIAVAKYPKGHMAAQEFTMKIYKEKDLQKKEELLAAFKKEFPNENMDGPYGGMIYTMAKEKDQLKGALGYLNLIKDKDQRFINAYHLGVNAALLDPAFAKPFLQKELSEFASIETAPVDPAKPNNNKAIYNEMRSAYGGILVKEAKDKEALPYIKTAYENARPDDVDKRVAYANLLMRLGNYKDAFPVLDKLVKDGKGNPQLKKELADSYAKVNGGKDGTAYVAGIEKELTQKLMDDYLKLAMNKPAPAFTVTDENGKAVSLADFKGKTIVVDFWATWCGPCKKSFPAMQRVVNKYKDDPNVKFLFVHTWETTKTPLKDAKTYLTANHYTFDLYIDPKDSSVTPASNKAVQMFGVQGIPQKFVIDGNGNIRFNVSGFDDGDDAAVEELTAMIEYTKKN